jgi:predicted helicase
MPNPRHLQSFKLVESRLFAGLSCFADLEDRINALLTPQERGAAFEVFAEAYLATQRVPQAKEVWPIGTESLELRQRLVLPATDKGIDGLILAEDDQFTAYQVKFRQDRQTILWNDLGNFFGLADRVPQRLVFTNAYEVGETATERLGFMAVRGADLDELDAQDFAVIEAWLAGQKRTRVLASPGKHQMEAILGIRQGLQNGDRALALMACGSGKTLTALWVTEQMGVKTVLILLPSLALVRQTLHEWLRHTSWPRGGMSYICVCSDTTVDRDSDEILVRPGDLDFPVTTDASVLKSFLSREYDGVRLVFSTYQSSKVVIEASAGMPPFDLGIFDEAHKTAGRPGMRFGL